MPVPTATAGASLYRTSGAYRSVPGVGTVHNVSLASSCYDDCMWDCRLEGWESYECKPFCRQKCTGPPPCLGELCLFGPQRRCCPYGTTCCYGYEYPSARQIIGCCAPGWECCGEGKCCEPGHTCCAPSGFGPSKCCPPGQKCCGGVCYTPGPGSVCTGDGTVCPQDQVCGDRCCPPGGKCLGGRCCKPGPLCGGGQCCEGERCTPTGCCPQDRYTTTLGCCPQGQVACRVRTEGPPEVEPGGEPGSDPTVVYVEKCCPPGYSCSDDSCCPPGECCEKNADCPPGKHCDKKKCCAQGQKAKYDPTTGKLSCA
ncbi:hypothetical protein ACVILE_006946 [Streptomyces sp. M18.1]